MLQHFAGRLVLALTLVALTAACGGKMVRSEAVGEGVAIRVNNNVLPPTSLTVFAVSETGSRQILGSVSPSSTKTFNYDPVSLSSSRFRLLARTTTGKELASQPFTLTGTAGLEWQVNSNSIRFFE